MCAAEHGHLDIVKFLLAQADCDSTRLDVVSLPSLKSVALWLIANLNILGWQHGAENLPWSWLPRYRMPVVRPRAFVAQQIDA